MTGVEELDLLRKIANKIDGLESKIDMLDRRLYTIETGFEFVRKTFESNGKSIANIQSTLTDHAREISDLGFEIRGTPIPEKSAAKFVRKRKMED
jgi:uncharacterized protein Yka (UPF0111/DUF47 family)